MSAITGFHGLEPTLKIIKFSKEIGPNHYRETFGRYFEDFKVGDIYEHRPGKTVTEYDNHLFTLMTLNTHPLHFDAEFGKGTEFKHNLVVSTYNLSLLIGMSVSDCSQKALSHLFMTDVKFTLPVFFLLSFYGSSFFLYPLFSSSFLLLFLVVIFSTFSIQYTQVFFTFFRHILIPATSHSV